MSSELIQRALITRIEVLEREVATREHGRAITDVECACIWDLVFPERHGQPFDATLVLDELKRRGLGNGKAGE